MGKVLFNVSAQCMVCMVSARPALIMTLMHSGSA